MTAITVSSFSVGLEGISCEGYNEFVDSVEACVGLVPVVGTLAGFVWSLAGEPLQDDCQKGTYPEGLVKAVELGSKELLQVELDLIGNSVGLEKVTKNKVGVADCIITELIFYHNID